MKASPKGSTSKERIVATRVHPDLADEFESAAATEHKTISEKLRELMAGYVKRSRK